MDVTEDHVAERVERLKRMFASEPDISVRLDTDGGKVVAEVVVPIRGYRTLKACSKADDASGAWTKLSRSWSGSTSCSGRGAASVSATAANAHAGQA